MSNDSSINPIQKLANIFKAKEMVEPKLDAPLDASAIIDKNIRSLFENNEHKETFSFSTNEEKETMENILHSLDLNEDGILNEKELLYLTSFNKDNDNDEKITQEDLLLFTQKTKEVQALEDLLQSSIKDIDKIISEFYPNKNLEELSEEDIEKAIFVQSMMNETQKRDEAIQAYYNTEGWVDGTYNWIKELFDSGLTREDIDEYLKNEKTLNTMLQASLQNGGSLQIVENKAQDGEISKETIKNVVTDRLSGFDNSKDILIYAKEQLGLTDEELIPIIRESLIDSPLYANLDIANPDLARVVWDEENQDYRVFWNNEDDTGALLSDKYHSNNGHYTTKFLENLKNTTNNKYIEKLNGNIDFEKLYSLFTGVEYNTQAIQEANEASIGMQEITKLQQGALYQEQFFAQDNINHPAYILEYFKNTYECSNEEAIQYFNQYYETMFSKTDEDGYPEIFVGDSVFQIYCTSYSISADGKTVIEEYAPCDKEIQNIRLLEDYGYTYDKETGKITREYPMYKEEGDYSGETNLNINYTSAFSNSNIFHNINSTICEKNLLLNTTIDNFNKEYGENAFNNIIENYIEKSQNAYGNNVLNSKFEDYQLDMDSYSAKISNAISMAGFALSFINPAFGYMALAGMYTDNLIDLGNITSNNIANENELPEWFLNTMKEVGCTAIGFKFASWANTGSQKFISHLLRKGATEGQAVFGGTMFEYLSGVATGTAFDSGMSYLETGKYNVLNNLYTNLIFGSQDLRGGMGLYRAVKGGHVDINYLIGAYADTVSPKFDSDTFMPRSDIDGINLGVDPKINPHDAKYPVLPEIIERIGDSGSLYKKIEKLVPEAQFRVEKLMSEGMEPVYAYQIGRLTDAQIADAKILIEQGVPTSRAADTAVLMDEHSGRINDLIGNSKVQNYYIADIARLPENQYKAVIKAIEEGVSAPSAIENAKSLATGEITPEVIKSDKMKKEITPEVEKELTRMAKILATEYEGEIGKSKDSFFAMLLGEGATEVPENHPDYADLTSRSKGDNSVLCKLIAKYEKDKLKIDFKTPEANIDAGRTAVTDAYGSRLQMKSLTADDVEAELKKAGFDKPECLDEFKDVIRKASDPTAALTPKEQEYLNVLNKLKEKQSAPVFEALLKAIENKSIDIKEINNYGNAVSSYFTDAQLYTLVDTYRRTHGVIPETVTQRADVVQDRLKSDALDEELLLGKYRNGYNPKEIESRVIKKGSVKDSGYTSSQLTFAQNFDGIDCYGEFQIRGTEVNKFGDVEHVPYDIRQGKITGKDIEYADVYNAIKNMDENSFKRYNQYLTEVYDYLRCKELGINMGKMPQLEDFDLKFESGTPLEAEILRKLSYEGLLTLPH